MKKKIYSIISEGPKTFDQIRRQADISAHKCSKFLNELIRKEKIYYRKSSKKYFKREIQEIVFGIFRDTRNQYGFCETEAGATIFIPPRFTQNALEGDSIKVSIFNNDDPKDTKKAGKIIRIVKRNSLNIVGRIYENENGEKIFKSDDNLGEKYKYSLLSEEINTYGLNDILVTKFIDYSDGIIILKVIRKIGNGDNAKIDQEVLLEKYNIDEKFPPQILTDLEKINSNIEYEGRRDLTTMLTYTIDSETSKDLDDAISINKIGENFQLYVHIADVSKYVEQNSPIDEEARRRSTSIYLNEKVVPMLPKKLSNDLCSLNPNKKRYAITCEMLINNKGETTDVKVFPSIIESDFQLSYKEVDETLKDEQKKLRSEDKLSTNMTIAFELSKILRSRKHRNGMINFKIHEIKHVMDEHDVPEKLVPKMQTESEALVEDFMVAANENIAALLGREKLMGIFRVHEDPNILDLRKLIEISKNFSHPITKKPEAITSKDIQIFLEKIEDHPNERILTKYVLQAMAKARYSDENIGHYALGLKNYLHFTSPIRRYPDLIVHRILKNYYFNNNEKLKEKIDPRSLAEICLNATKKEIEATQIERKFNDIKKVRYVKKHRESFENDEWVIISITKMGIFLEPKSKEHHYIHGLVKFEDIKNDEYFSDDKGLKAIGKHSKREYKLGDYHNAKILDIDIVRGIINLKFTEDEDNSKKQKS